MKECVQNGFTKEGILPGGLKVKRRAPTLHTDLKQRTRMDMITPSLGAMDWVNLYALAVSEENAAGGRMVTAPTNGAAGIIPAVLHYYDKFCPNTDEEGVIKFLLAATAIGILCKLNASISGAEIGCQGEVGLRLCNGSSRTGRSHRRHTCPGGERRRDRYRAQPGPDL